MRTPSHLKRGEILVRVHLPQYQISVGLLRQKKQRDEVSNSCFRQTESPSKEAHVSPSTRNPKITLLMQGSHKLAETKARPNLLRPGEWIQKRSWVEVVPEFCVSHSCSLVLTLTLLPAQLQMGLGKQIIMVVDAISYLCIGYFFPFYFEAFSKSLPLQG